MKKYLALFLMLAGLVFGTDYEVSNVALLYAIGEDATTRDYDCYLTADINLDYLDNDIGGSPVAYMAAGAQTEGSIVKGIDFANTDKYLYCTDAHTITTWTGSQTWASGDLCYYVNLNDYIWKCILGYTHTVEDTPDIDAVHWEAFTGSNSDYWAIVGSVSKGWRGFGYDPGTDVPFTGTFDGQGHTISNLYQLNPRGGNGAAGNTVNGGLFGAIGATGQTVVIKNLYLTGVNVTDTGMVGGLMSNALAAGVTITNCHVTGSVTISGGGGNQGGGFSGSNGAAGSGATITDCSSTVNVTVAAGSYGGSFSSTVHGTATRCWATGTVKGGARCGGFVYRTNGGVFTDCYYVNTSTGAIDGTEEEGGFAANCITSAPTFTRVYCAAALEGTATDKGSFVGKLNSLTPTATACYFDDDIDNGSGGTVATAKTTAQMKQASTFSGAWDFYRIWNISTGTNSSYPYILKRSSDDTRSRYTDAIGYRHRVN